MIKVHVGINRGKPAMREAHNAGGLQCGGRTRVNMEFPGQNRHKRALESQGRGDKWHNTWGKTIKGHYPITLNAADKHSAGADQTC